MQLKDGGNCFLYHGKCHPPKLFKFPRHAFGCKDLNCLLQVFTHTRSWLIRIPCSIKCTEIIGICFWCSFNCFGCDCASTGMENVEESMLRWHWFEYLFWMSLHQVKIANNVNELPGKGACPECLSASKVLMAAANCNIYLLHNKL